MKNSKQGKCFFLFPVILLLYAIYAGKNIGGKEVWEETRELQTEKKQEKTKDASYIGGIEEAVCVLDSGEQEQIQAAAESVANSCSDLYKDIEVLDTTFYQLGQRSKKQRQEVVSRIGELGFVSVSKGINMENYKGVEAFYSGYLNGEDAKVTIYDVYSDGRIGCRTFLYRNRKL